MQVGFRLIGTAERKRQSPEQDLGLFCFMGHHLYILQSKSSSKFYVGISDNPERRLEFHNTIEKGFTSRYRPWEIVFLKEYASKEEALYYERKIKSWKSKLMIEKLLRGEIEI